jgi:dolichyl-diphosphooligosaccharide--protein glycosyltransferase
MVRLILLTAPIASSLGGVFFGRVGAWMIEGSLELYDIFMGDDAKQDVPSEEPSSKKTSGKTGKTPSKSSKDEKPEEKITESKLYRVRTFILLGRLVASIMFVRRALPLMNNFRKTAHEVAQQISHPTIITKAKLQSGEVIMVDDYRDAYFWLRDNTPEDARIMAWWDCKLRYKKDPFLLLIGTSNSVFPLYRWLPDHWNFESNNDCRREYMES